MEEGSGAGKRPRPTAPPTPNPRTEADDADGGDERDQDMDRFYALLGSIRAMRDLLRTNGNLNKRRKVEPAPLWRPTFELEDFERAEEPDPAVAESALNPSPSSSDRKGKKEEKGGDRSVDLSLSL